MTHESTSESPSPVDKSAYTIKSSTVLMAERGVPDSNPLPPAADTGTVEDLDEMAGLPIDAQGKPIDGAAAEAAEIIASFLSAYATRDLTQTCEQWLVEQFHRYPSLWNGDAEIESAAYEVASTIGEVNTQKASLNAAMAAGQSRANWFADSLERVTAAQGIADVGAYAATIERALDQATLNSAKVIQRADGAISGCTNLDGFIAEQHHVDSFNIDVAAKGSTYSAEVMTPELGQPYRKNSVDLVIRDADSRVVRRYQSKDGADAEATNHLYKQGDYRGQRKLVPEGHSEGVSGSTETIEVDGISSSPLTKEQAKQQQYDAQQDGESKRYGWDQVSRGAIAHQIMKRSLLSATISVGFQGARILGRRAWNTLRGKPNTTISDDLREFFSSSLTSASNAALHTALAGAMVIAVKRGLLGRLLKQTPAGQIATATYIALENIKVLWKLGRGEITTDEALDAMGEITTVVLVTTFAMAEGSAIGMQIGAVFGPIGAAIGAFIGGVVAGIAGNAAGKLIYAGAKKLCTKVALNRPEFPSHLLAVYYGDQGDGYEQQAVYG